MTDKPIDYAGVFRALPGMVAVLTPDLVYVDANDEFLRIAGRDRERTIGRSLYDSFPVSPNDPHQNGVRTLASSLRRVVETGERDIMAPQRYDVESAERPGEWEERYWSPVNAPVFGPDGTVDLVVLRAEEITELIRARGGPVRGRTRVLEAELYARARELQEVNEQLRAAHAREREVAIALQEAMLPAPGPIGPHRAAVRYRPAIGALNVCGDWYDLVTLDGGGGGDGIGTADTGDAGGQGSKRTTDGSGAGGGPGSGRGDRIGVAVGDVVGHGLAAAGVMGQLRSALSAASRVASGPAKALDVLDLYARSVEGAENSTAVETWIDFERKVITYSSAGHPPPVLVHTDGTVEFLDRATDPPLGAYLRHGSRPQAEAAFTPGGTLVLYTDGLIERRHEDIDAGLDRLAEALRRHRTSAPETLADALLLDMLPVGGATDDTALIVIGL
ncbi:SpoIIE family protein phosphatase [Streptomyces sp. NPDC048717]|uniref:PP2C family protein-serine/threonine phosphatase n=1 Tax=Streptomyces sp. NPDC048717 TaxID=3154928 RepID=UPI0034153E34